MQRTANNWRQGLPQTFAELGGWLDRFARWIVDFMQETATNLEDANFRTGGLSLFSAAMTRTEVVVVVPPAHNGMITLAHGLRDRNGRPLRPRYWWVANPTGVVQVTDPTGQGMGAESIALHFATTLGGTLTILLWG